MFIHLRTTFLALQIAVFVWATPLTGCEDHSSAQNTSEEQTHLPTETCVQRMQPETFRESFAGEIDARLFSFEVAAQTDVAFVSSPAFGDDAALALTVRPDVLVNGGNRAEISVNNSDPHCQEAWTRWHVLIPTDFEDTAPDDLRWQIIAQWHDQPEPGQAWEGNSPAIQIQYGTYDTRFAEIVRSISDETFTQGDPIFTLSYGARGGIEPVGVLKMEKGRWYTFTTHTLFSQGTDGFAAVWVDDIPLVTRNQDGYARGANAYNTAPSYLKLGMYRNPEIRSTNTLVLDDFSRAASREGL